MTKPSNTKQGKRFQKYLDWAEFEYFHIANGKNVLEFGPFSGLQTEIILKNKPLFYMGVEPNTDKSFDALVETVKYHYWGSTEGKGKGVVFPGTANDFYKEQKEHYGVVFCCGLLYHLHSPQDLLEKIVNYNTPEFVVISSTHIDTDMFQEYESKYLENSFGRVVEHDIPNPIRLSLLLSSETVKQMMKSMGFLCIKEHTAEEVSKIWTTDAGVPYYWQMYRGPS